MCRRSFNSTGGLTPVLIAPHPIFYYNKNTNIYYIKGKYTENLLKFLEGYKSISLDEMVDLQKEISSFLPHTLLDLIRDNHPDRVKKSADLYRQIWPPVNYTV